jgi:hypothetical protein
MARRVLLALALPVVAALTWSLAADKPQPPSEPKPAAKAEPSPAERLARRLDFPGLSDPDTKLGDALDLLAKEAGLTFDVNEKAFADEQVEDVLSRPIGAVIPKMKNVSAERVLYKLLARVPAQSGATFLVRREAVEITTGQAQAAEVWSPGDQNLEVGSRREPRLPLVNADFERAPLSAALRDLARQSGMNVIVDARLAEKAKMPVTAHFRNAPLDTAVRTLADMADLKPFLIDNALYVTTADNADRLEERERPKAAAGGQPDDVEGGPSRVGSGPPHGRRLPAEPGGM